MRVGRQQVAMHDAVTLAIDTMAARDTPGAACVRRRVVQPLKVELVAGQDFRRVSGVSPQQRLVEGERGHVSTHNAAGGLIHRLKTEYAIVWLRSRNDSKLIAVLLGSRGLLFSADRG